MNLAERIKEIRRKTGLTQADVGEKLGIASQNYNLLENGKTELTYSKIVKLAEIFGVSVVELLGEGASVVVAGTNDNTKELEAMKVKNEALEREIKDLREILQFTKKSFYTIASFRISVLRGLNEAEEMEKIYNMSIPEAETYLQKLLLDYNHSRQDIALQESKKEKTKPTFKRVEKE